ncbi:hypothetical protein HXP45_21815 [Streptomyces actuosus]|uniref:Uncharacterized protein n=2 Tax=Streptomyces TaxID=1883 RepID=A0A2U9PBU9_STRAS|nr:hypothetical protein DMT42_35955 [Streptomyces actuosus]MBM4823692.1 hypothetical protein [Streptomyces actuosus]
MDFRRGRRDAGAGVHITGSGNQINTGQVGGDQRQVHIVGHDAAAAQLQTVLARLADVTAALDEHAGELNNADAARLAAARIDEELRSPTPDRRRITETLETLALAVGTATAVLTTVEGLAHAITDFFT